MDKPVRILYLPLTKANWTSPELEEARENARRYLGSLPGVEVLGGEEMIQDEISAMAVLEKSRGLQIDLVVGHLLSFALGVILGRFAQTLHVPVVLWSIPEPPPEGGRLRANSFCAANMNSHILYKLYVPYFHVHGNTGEERTTRQLEHSVKVTKVLAMFKELRIGSIGGRVPGFFTSDYDEMLLRNKIGAEVVPLTALEMTARAKNMEAARIDEAVKILLSDASLHAADAPEKEHLRKSAALYCAVQDMFKDHMLGAVTLRCWPEVIADEMYGITLCSTIGHLNNHDLLAVCEGDVYAAVLLSAMKEFSSDAPFFCDLIQMEEESDHAVAWHCGAAPCSLCSSSFRPELRRSSTVGGGGVKGCVCEFPLKKGKVTFARLGETRSGDSFRLLIATGEGLETDLFVRGTPLKVRFDAGNKTMRDELIRNGWEHHFSMAYGDLSEELLSLGRALNIETTLLK